MELQLWILSLGLNAMVVECFCLNSFSWQAIILILEISKFGKRRGRVTFLAFCCDFLESQEFRFLNLQLIVTYLAKSNSTYEKWNIFHQNFYLKFLNFSFATWKSLGVWFERKIIFLLLKLSKTTVKNCHLEPTNICNFTLKAWTKTRKYTARKLY